MPAGLRCRRRQPADQVRGRGSAGCCRWPSRAGIDAAGVAARPTSRRGASARQAAATAAPAPKASTQLRVAASTASAPNSTASRVSPSTAASSPPTCTRSSTAGPPASTPATTAIAQQERQGRECGGFFHHQSRLEDRVGGQQIERAVLLAPVRASSTSSGRGRSRQPASRLASCSSSASPMKKLRLRPAKPRHESGRWRGEEWEAPLDSGRRISTPSRAVLIRSGPVADALRDEHHTGGPVVTNRHTRWPCDACGWRTDVAVMRFLP